jgi:hypothetical protein
MVVLCAVSLGPLRLVALDSTPPARIAASSIPPVEFRRTEYELSSAIDRLPACGMPGIDDLLPESLLKPVPRDEVAAYFEQQAGRG